MALPEQEKQRIREEEAYRLQVRDEYRNANLRSAAGSNLRMAIFWLVLVLVAIGLWVVIRAHP